MSSTRSLRRVSLRRVSLISVLYGGGAAVKGSIISAQVAAERAGVELEVIAVDNRPGDGTAELVRSVAPDVIVISNEDNVGFGRACNQGFESATGQWWFLLNPDATIHEDAMAMLIGFIASRPTVAAVAPIMTGAGRDAAESAGMQPGIRSAIGHFWLANRLLRGDDGGPWRGLQLLRRLELGPRQVQWVSGGAVMLRPEAVEKVAGFDPSFFLYAEDVDLGRRLEEAGWESWLLPDAMATHSIAGSAGGVTDRWYVALHDYVGRGAGRFRVVLFDLIAATGLAVRGVASRSDGLHRRRMAVAARAAFRLAARTAVLGVDRG